MKKRALIVVDAQLDFTPVSEEDFKNKKGGALAVPDGDKIMPVINDLFSKFDLVIFTMDWHPHGMYGFASTHDGMHPFEKYINSNGEEDVLWPDHCIQGTDGAMLHHDIDLRKLKGTKFYIFKKGLNKEEHPYSGFGAEGLLEFLNERNIKKLYICGLALDYCVKATAIDAIDNDFETYVIEDATKAVVPEDTEKVKDKLKNHKTGATIITSEEIEIE